MQSKNLWWVGLFAIAMAYLESAVVVYLRRIYGISDLILHVPPFDPQIGAIELGRELATLIMLLTVGWVAGRKFKSRLGFAVFAFGLWDIFYYIWLRVFIGWPRTLLDPDLLFLIPLPWWGPVLAPVLIAALMIAGGVLAVINDDRRQTTVRLQPAEWAVFIAGNLAMLYAFMSDALAALPADTQTLSQLRPSEFNWPVYLVGFAMLALFVWRMGKPVEAMMD
ncbi:MAG: hypothetical protein JETCAE01_26320 [Anaerolineaceae bacterium]|nr:MAG: hypothetical protein JETCAE01_26320 [Anaerolineaceae bacterium]